MYIIVPSAKIVPEDLQKLGKLPAVVYPVNQKTVFDYLYKEYRDARFRVIVYENASLVHRHLNKYKVEIIDLDTLRDLGNTIYHGIKDITGEGVINFADTIVEDNICQYSGDAFFYSEDVLSDTWTFFEERKGVITKIIDKESIDNDNQGSLFVGVFKFAHLEYLKTCLERAFETSHLKISTFYYAVKLYSRKYPFKVIKTSNWFDIGHADKYFSSELEVKAREFNHIKIDKNRGILTKKSDNVDKFIGEIKWYLKLPVDIEYVRPRIFSYSTSYTDPSVSMEYYSYHTVHELFLYGDLSKKQWSDIFQRILFVCRDFKRYSVSDDKIQPALQDMYLTKTISRFDRLKEDNRFTKFFESPITINNHRFVSLGKIISVLKRIVPDMLYDINEFHIIHGDLCFANIMIDDNYNFVKVIDPRGKFGEFDIYGDTRYELAKLFHSVDGKYDFIIKDLFDINYNLEKVEIQYMINDRVRDFDLYQLFIDTFQQEIGDDLKKIELIEALLFLSMIPLHGESFNHQLVMLGTGLDILNRIIDITE